MQRSWAPTGATMPHTRLTRRPSFSPCSTPSSSARSTRTETTSSGRRRVKIRRRKRKYNQGGRQAGRRLGEHFEGIRPPTIFSSFSAIMVATKLLAQSLLCMKFLVQFLRKIPRQERLRRVREASQGAEGDCGAEEGAAQEDRDRPHPLLRVRL